MSRTPIQFSNLLRMTEIQFEPSPPPILRVSDELFQSLAWLTAATKDKRLLLRCNEQGALLVDRPWSLLTEVEVDELYPQSETPDSFIKSVDNKGVLISTSTQLVKVDFVRVSGGATETIYIPADEWYWFGHPTYSVTITLVPESGGTANYVGVTAFN